MTRRVSRKSDAERAARRTALGKSRRMSAGKAPAAKAWRILVSTSLRSRRALVGGPSAPQRPPKPTWMWLSREPAIPSAAVTQAGPASAEAPTLLAAVPGRPPAGKAGTSSRPQAQYCGHPSSRGGDRRDLSWTPRRGPACEAGSPSCSSWPWPSSRSLQTAPRSCHRCSQGGSRPARGTLRTAPR